MYELKTKETDSSVIEFMESIENEKKKEDAYKLLDIFTQASGHKAKMWGPSIIGFGSYHYKYASGHEGDAPLVGFSPRKAKFSLYLAVGDTLKEDTLKNLGKCTAGKACVYVNKLDDIDISVLEGLIKRAIELINKTYPS